MNKNMKLFWAAFIILLIIFNAFLAFDIFMTRERLDLAVKELNILRNTKEVLQESIDGLAGEKRDIREENKKLQASLAHYRKEVFHQPRLAADEIAELKGKGLKDPVNDIRADLMQRNELIPYKGVLGGTMRFLSERDIHVLSTRWVRAHFEDGHIGGWILLEYQISGEGKILWEVVECYPDF